MKLGKANRQVISLYTVPNDKDGTTLSTSPKEKSGMDGSDGKSNEEKKNQKKMKKYKLDPAKEEFPSVFKDNDKRNQLFEHLPLTKIKKLKKVLKVLDVSTGTYDIQFPNDA